MIKSSIRILISLFGVLLISNGIEAQNTITLSPTKDTYLRASTGTTDGSATTMTVQRQRNNRHARAILEFDISSIPSGATIVSAELILTQNSSGGYTDNIYAYPLTQDWTESGAIWNNSGIAGWDDGGAYNSSYLQVQVLVRVLIRLILGI